MVLGLDIYNGTQAQLQNFRSVSTITFPLLLQAGSIRGSHGTHTLLIADREGIVRHIGRGASGLSAAAASIRELLTAQPPAIDVPGTSLDFGEDIPAGESRTLTLVVKNTGGEDLSVTDMESDLEGVTFSLTELTVAPGDSATVDITFTPSEGGPFSGTITISSDDPENSSVSVAISGTAIVVPVNPRADFDNDGEIGFSDFLAFAQAFSTDNPTFDLNGNGLVDFPDFLEFAKNFGKSVP
ncbi:MAG: choice-of-anchor D domain-containing protein [Gemmatimonadota bacterium]|nr:choice-of-anchor D domain-containing protein [Gemmatimonadota bacterium]